MMKNLSKNVIVSLVVVTISLFVLAGAAYATGLNLNPTTTPANNQQQNNQPTNATGNQTRNTVTTPTTTPSTSAPRNTSDTVKINDVGTEKDLPQTGENDIYVITLVGIVAVAIGAVAYVKSKKYDL